MGEPLKRPSERVNYIGNFIEASRSVRSVRDIEAGRTYIWGDLQQIEDAKVRREAQEMFRNTMSLAEAMERSSPDKVAEVVLGGMRDLIDYLEANDLGPTE